MRESGFYPAGAEFDPRAPYNEPLTEERYYMVQLEVYTEEEILTVDEYVTVEVCGYIDRFELKEFVTDELKRKYEDFCIINIQAA